jgi:hypothetical protein
MMIAYRICYLNAPRSKRPLFASHDRALMRLTNALDAFAVDTQNLRRDALAPGKWREEVWWDLVEWVVPTSEGVQRSEQCVDAQG